MPLQNRVLPTGEIVAAAFRGTLMGNRGILHDGQRQLGVARWRHRNWVCCLLSFKGRHRPVMQPGPHYTELFFHDEAVALAAGHRPCAECRRADYEGFRDAWQAAFGARPPAPEIDRVLHAARVDSRSRAQIRHAAEAADLPDGAMALLEGVAHLQWQGALHPWSVAGYGPARPPVAGPVTVLTPAPNVAVLAAGYRPAVAL